MQHLQPNTNLQNGKYRIEKVLGQGGFGNTYVGYNTEFEETVAIKEFFMRGVTERDETTCQVSVSNSDNILQFEEQREKFKKEARRLRKLKSEHIVKVHDLFEENGTAYYVMDFIDGESLAERIKRTGKALSESEVKRILLQILDALDEVHKNEIWHLDLKPGNVMIDKEGFVYLIDFGASKQIRANGNMTTSTALCYTPGYAPNEQIGQMFDRFGPWTDIYALGATIYNMLTNKKPPMAIDIEDDEDDAFDFPSGVSPQMRELVVWMMQPKRKKRPQSVGEINGKMEAYSQFQTINPTKHDETKTIITDTKRESSINDEETILNSRRFHQKDGVRAKAVDLGLSVKWADCNVGGSSDAPIGGLYGWADATGLKTSLLVHDYVPLKEYITHRISDNIAGTENDIASVQWGTKWRMPTREHWKELIEKCKWTKAKLFHVEGYQVEGPNGNKIFLPFTGLRFDDKISNTNAGYYWTSEGAINDRECAYYFYFDNKKVNDTTETRNYVYSGRAVRPICDY